MTAGMVETTSNQTHLSGGNALARFVRRNWWVVLASVAICVIAGFVYLARAAPGYRATAVMLVPPQAGELRNPDHADPSAEAVRSHLEMLNSPQILDDAVKRLDLTRDPEFAVKTSGASARVQSGLAREQLLSKLTFDISGRSNTVSVTASSRRPDKAARIANTVAQTYIDAQLAQDAKLAVNRTAGLSKQLDGLRVTAASAEDAADAYRRKVGLIPISSELEDGDKFSNATPASRELVNMTGQHAWLAARRAEAFAKVAVQLRARARGTADSTPEVLASPVVTELRATDAKMQSKEASLAARYLPGHPLLVPVQAGLQEVGRSLAAEIERIHESVISEAVASNLALENADAFLRHLAERRSRDLQVSVKFDQLRGEAKLKRNTYKEFAGQLRTTSIQAATDPPNALLVSPASPAVERTSPDAARVLYAATLLGLLIGLTVGLIRTATSYLMVKPSG